MVIDWKSRANVNGLKESKDTQSGWEKWIIIAKFVPTHDSEIGCSDHFIDQIPISTLSIHSLYTVHDRLEGLS